MAACKWALHIDTLGVSQEDARWQLCLHKLLDDPNEMQNVTKFYFFDDQRRALGSILLQKALIRSAFGFLDNSQFSISRTADNKPYIDKSKIDPLSISLSLWNFNVSHHGPYVCIGSDPNYLIGVDIVDLSTRLDFISEPIEYFSMFEKQLTVDEFAFIMEQPSDNEKYKVFFIIWALKESYIKAIGRGLIFPLREIEFRVEISSEGDDHCCNGHGYLYINSVLMSNWRFSFAVLNYPYVTAVALGPPQDACDTVFKDHVSPVCSEAIVSTESDYPVFQMKSLLDLVPVHLLRELEPSCR